MFAVLFALILATPAPVLSVHTLFPPVETPKEWTVPEMKALATETAKKHGLKVQKFLDVVNCEVKKRPDGSWDYKAQSDHYKNGKREDSWGMWQINLYWNPQVTKEQAQDPEWSTEWAATAWANGNARWWSCYNILYGKMADWRII